MQPNDKIALIRRLSTDIHQRLAQAPPESLTAPSACPGWDVGTVVAHITGGAQRQYDSMIRGRAGHGGPPEGVAGTTTPDEVQQRNAISNVELRHEWGDALLDRFRDAYDALYALLTGWTDWTIGCWHHRRGTMSADSYLDLRIQELVIHDWDMRAGGSTPATLDTDGAAALLPRAAMWYELCFRPTARLPKPLVYRVEVGQRPEALHVRDTLIVSGDSFRLLSAPDAPAANLVIACPAETYLLCLYGRIPWRRAVQDGHVALSSPANLDNAEEMMAKFSAWFDGI